MINEVINAILGLRLPQKPRTQIVIGKIAGGFNHGKIAYDANIGFEIRSDSDEMVKDLYGDIRDIVDEINKTFAVELKLNRISNLNATRLRYNHPLVKCASRILNRLGVEAVSEPSETALSIFLQRKIPAVTLGLDPWGQLSPKWLHDRNRADVQRHSTNTGIGHGHGQWGVR